MSESEWRLEVVRGRQAGRSYALAGPETVLGNALSGIAGIDLADQEGDSPRRMAARQAVVAAVAAGLAVRDLDSPGGTFVNRRRVLPGESFALRGGDVLQLGGVQLRVISASNGRPSNPAPGLSTEAPATPFALKNGTVCRTWDDFLRVAAQRWGDLRDELTSNRLASWLSTIGRPDLVVHRLPSGTADDHLDAWLARLPTAATARPELDVHPIRLVIRASPGGGTLARSVQVANVGHRLLHIRAAIEPADVAWVKVVAPFGDAPQTVLDAVDLPLEVVVPESLPTPLRATLLLDGDGGMKRVELVLEPRSSPEPIAQASSDAGPFDWLARVAPGSRLVTFVLIAVVMRLAVALAGGTGLVGPAALFAVAAAGAGAVLAGRRGGMASVGFGAASAAIAGAGMAALFVAACRVVEPTLGGWSRSTIAVALLWAAIGGAKAIVSLRVVPFREPTAETGP